MFIFKHCITLYHMYYWQIIIIRNFFTFFLSFYFLIRIRIGYVIIFSSNLFIWSMRNVKFDDKYIKKKEKQKNKFHWHPFSRWKSSIPGWKEATNTTLKLLPCDGRGNRYLLFFLYSRISNWSWIWPSRHSSILAIVSLSVNSPYMNPQRQDFCIT